MPPCTIRTTPSSASASPSAPRIANKHDSAATSSSAAPPRSSPGSPAGRPCPTWPNRPAGRKPAIPVMAGPQRRCPEQPGRAPQVLILIVRLGLVRVAGLILHLLENGPAEQFRGDLDRRRRRAPGEKHNGEEDERFIHSFFEPRTYCLRSGQTIGQCHSWRKAFLASLRVVSSLSSAGAESASGRCRNDPHHSFVLRAAWLALARDEAAAEFRSRHPGTACTAAD